MNNIRKYKSIIICCVFFLITIFFPIVSKSRANDINTQEKKIISQIKSYYNQGKKSIGKGDFLTAIVKFNRVIDLEKDLCLVYTPYAKQYIQLAQEEIREKEEQKLRLNIKKEPPEMKTASSNKPEDAAVKKAIPEVSASNETSPKGEIEYTIAEADILYISVWQEENLDLEVIVRPDGKISFPLAGDIPAVGLTFSQLKEEITRRLKDYIKYPVVSISLRKLGGKKIIVLGEVGSPGVYSVTGKRTILEAIALAGGFTQDAVLSSVILIQGGLENPKGARVNLSSAINKADVSQNVVLEPEDIVYVPKKFIANVNYTIGQILGPIYQGTVAIKTTQGW